jgi:hypothetical protein
VNRLNWIGLHTQGYVMRLEKIVMQYKNLRSNTNVDKIDSNFLQLPNQIFTYYKNKLQVCTCKGRELLF